MVCEKVLQHCYTSAAAYITTNFILYEKVLRYCYTSATTYITTNFMLCEKVLQYCYTSAAAYITANCASNSFYFPHSLARLLTYRCQPSLATASFQPPSLRTPVISTNRCDIRFSTCGAIICNEPVSNTAVISHVVSTCRHLTTDSSGKRTAFLLTTYASRMRSCWR